MCSFIHFKQGVGEHARGREKEKVKEGKGEEKRREEKVVEKKGQGKYLA
jgi:hypothetical protein